MDLIVHFGHAPFGVQGKVPAVYVEAKTSAPVEAAVLQALPLLKNYAKIGLATTVQHIHALDRAKELLVKAGKTVVIGDSGQLAYAGQVIGCNYSNVTSIAKRWMRLFLSAADYSMRSALN